VERPKRVPKEKYLAKHGREHRAEGWDGAFLFLDDVMHGEAVYLTRSSSTSLTLPEKMNHLNAVNNDDCTIRIRKGLISGAEMTRCKRTRLFVRGHVATVQIDLCESVSLHFDSITDAENCIIVHSSNSGGIAVHIKDHETTFIETSLLGDQQATVLTPVGWKSVLTATIKHKRGYLDLDAVREY
jgi:hypothetical protein